MVRIGRKLKTIRQLREMNQGDFGRLFGLSRPTYTKYEKDELDVDETMLNTMSTALQIDKADLTDGEFEENITSVRKTGRYAEPGPKIPFWDTIAVGGNVILADQSPLDQPNDMIYPGTFLSRATGSLRVYGHSMFPKYPAGSIIAYRDADKELIIWGEDYVIELEDRRIIKRLEKHELKDMVKAVSYNKSEEYVYAPIELPVHKIKRLFMVLGKIEVEASI